MPAPKSLRKALPTSKLLGTVASHLILFVSTISSFPTPWLRTRWNDSSRASNNPPVSQSTNQYSRYLERRLPVSGLERGQACHPERSEGSLRPASQILRCAQDDMPSLQMSISTALPSS